MTGPSESVEGLTQLKPGRVSVTVGVSVVVGDGDAVSDGVEEALPIVVGAGVGVVPAM